MSEWKLFLEPSEQERIVNFSADFLANALLKSSGQEPILLAQAVYDLLHAVRDRQKAEALLKIGRRRCGPEAVAQAVSDTVLLLVLWDGEDRAAQQPFINFCQRHLDTAVPEPDISPAARAKILMMKLFS